MRALTNGQVLTPSGFKRGIAVIVEQGRIVELRAEDKLPLDHEHCHDLQGSYLVPGFIDCQVNGGGGVMFNDAPTVQTIRAIAHAHAQFGTTGFLPTLISDDTQVMRAAIASVDAAISEHVPGVIGIHLEGPYLAPERRGVHNAAKFTIPDSQDIDLVSSLRRGKTLLTLAPERVDSRMLRELAARGVILAIGHTAADYAGVREALANGIRGFTHLFNAMTPMQSREPGAVGAAIEDDNSWCGLIVDGFHVHPATLRIAIKAKAPGKMFLVTDAMAPVGSDNPSFQLDGQTITCHDGQCLNQHGVLAGSSLDMASAVRNTVEQVGLDLAEASRMASTYPAAFLGIQRTHGTIAVGFVADLVELDADLRVRSTWIGGRLVTREPQTQTVSAIA